MGGHFSLKHIPDVGDASQELRGWGPRHYPPVVYTLFRPQATGTELRTAGEELAGISGEGPDPP